MNYNPIGFFTFDNNAEVNVSYSGSILEIGWYDHNNPTVLHAPVSSSTLGFFTSSDVISVWVKCLDNQNNEIILTTTDVSAFHSNTLLAGTLFLNNMDLFYIGGPMLNGGEFYSYSITAQAWGGPIDPPTGEPLPGVLAALAISGTLMVGKSMKNKAKK